MLLRAAASNLQDLHRGLEGKSLSRQAAGSLLDAAGLALETASDLEASEIACQDKVVPGEGPDHLACYTSTGNPLVSEKRAFRKRRPRLPRSALLVLLAVLLTLAIVLPLLDASWLRGVLAALELKRYGAAEAAVLAQRVIPT